MNEVICLLDSDDEVEPQVAENAIARSDDDDEVEFIGVDLHSSAATETPLSQTSIRKPYTNSQKKSREAPKTTSSKTPTNPYAARPRVSLEGSATMTQERPRNPYAKATPRTISQSSQNGYDSDSSDDSLMRSESVFSSKKKPAVATTSITPRQATTTATTTPRQPASATTNSVNHPSTSSAAAQRTTTTSIMSPTKDPPFQYPALLHNSKQYEDLRPKYILAFWRYARRHVQHSYDRPKLDQLVNKIVLLSLTPFPIRSLEEYCFGRGVGAKSADKNKRNEIRQQLLEGGIETTVITTLPAHETKKYTSIAEACLVAMLTEIEHCLSQKGVNPRVLRGMDDASLEKLLSEKEMWIFLQDLIPAIDALLKPECPARLTRTRDQDNGAAHYVETTTRSAEFLQVKKLETCHKELGDYEVARIKRHRQRGKVLFELTHVGFTSARMVRERQFPLPPNYYRCSRIQSMSQVEAVYKNICIGVDLREGGGGHSALHEMCNTLDSKKVPFFVASLKIGDYVFFTRGPTGTLDNLCPILVERKSIEDIALSIHDGRWQRQKQRMYHGQFVFGYDNSRMVFIIEGKEERQQVSGGYIGHRMYDVDMQRVKDEIENLKSEGFQVLRTPSRQSTMFQLSRWAAKVAEEMESGTLKAEYNYARFNEEVKKIPRDTDFSRLAKYAMESREEKMTAAPAGASKRSLADVDNDSDIEVLEVFSPSDSIKPAACPTSKQKSPLVDRKKSAARTFGRGDIAAASWASQRGTPSTDLKKPAARASSADAKASAKKAKTNDNGGVYADWTTKQLQEACVRCGVAKSGKKADLIERLKGPHPPKLWLKRKSSKEYVPERHNVAGTALLVALYLHEKDAGDDDRGLTKDELYVKAEGLNITKNPFSGGTTQTGPYLYDGWSSMKSLLVGDPALVTRKKSRYRLTRSSDLAGYPIAEAMHKWCHDWNNCPCGATNL